MQALAVIIYPPTVDFRRWVQRPQQLLWQAAQHGHVVIFCNATQSSTQAMEKVSDRFYICHNFQALQGQTFPESVLYFTRPEHARYFGAMGTVRSIYDVVDTSSLRAAQAPTALASATHVWAASGGLRASILAQRADVVLVENGADYEHWATAPAAEPIGAAVLPGPRVAFLGPVYDWVDLEALFAAAEALPDVSFLVVGPVATRPWATLNPPPNLHALGERAYSLLPGYAHAADALIVPLRSEHPTAQGPNAINLWEFLATGKPVVCSGIGDSPIPCVERTELAAALRTALRKNEAAAAKRREIARANTWASRWQTVAGSLEGIA